jgi:hypothetical protein
MRTSLSVLNAWRAINMLLEPKKGDGFCNFTKSLKVTSCLRVRHDVKLGYSVCYV